METAIHNTSEIGRLKRVLLHRPGGELEILMPGETATHVEKWNLIKNVKMPETADEIDAVVEKYINK